MSFTGYGSISSWKAFRRTFKFYEENCGELGRKDLLGSRHYNHFFHLKIM